VPGLLASPSESLEEWPTARSFSDIDRIGLLHFDVGFKGYRGQSHVVSLIHPSFRGSNVPHRRYRRTQGLTAEVAMLRVGIIMASVRRMAGRPSR